MQGGWALIKRTKFLWVFTQGMLQALSDGITSPFLGINLIRLGAPNIALGALSSLPNLAGLIALPLGGDWIGRGNIVDKSSRLLFITRAVLLLLAGADLVHSPHYGWVLFLAALFVMGFTGSLANPGVQAINTMLDHEANVGRVLGIRQSLYDFASLPIMVLTGFLLAQYTGNVAYSRLYIVAFVIGIAECLSIRKVGRIPDYRLPESETPHMWETAKLVIVKVVPLLVFYIGWQLPWPAFLFYEVKVLHANNWWMAVFTAANVVGSMLTAWLWGILAKRHLNWLVVIDVAFMAIFPSVYFIHPGFTSLALFQIFGSVFSGTAGILMLTWLLHGVAKAQHSRVTSLNALLLAVSGSLAPLLGSWILASYSIWSSFSISIILRGVCIPVFLAAMYFDMLTSLSHVGD